MKTSYVYSYNPFERIYNKKGLKLSLLNDSSPSFKLTLQKFISLFNNSELTQY